MSCTLKRCQGKRGCICPKGSVPVGSYAGRSSDKSAPISTTSSSAKKDREIIEQTKSSSIKGKSSTASIKAPIATVSSTTAAAKASMQVAEKSSVPSLALPPTETSIPTSIISASSDDTTSPDANGSVIIRYNHYKKSFPITFGSTTSAAVDAEYFLSFAYPGSRIHLSTYSPSDFSYEEKGFSSKPLMSEQPIGVYKGLKVGVEYWVDIEEDPKEKEEYEKRQQKLAEESAKKRAEEEESEKSGAKLIQKTKTESCSCIEGNPCLDKYCCKDWEHRYDVAKKYGWKGFQ